MANDEMIELSSEVVRRLRAAASAQSLTMDEFVDELLQDYLKKAEPLNPEVRDEPESTDESDS